MFEQIARNRISVATRKPIVDVNNEHALKDMWGETNFPNNSHHFRLHNSSQSVPLKKKTQRFEPVYLAIHKYCILV